MRACINNQQIRHHNKCVILELLYRQKRANKSTLARLAQISIPAVIFCRNWKAKNGW